MKKTLIISLLLSLILFQSGCDIEVSTNGSSETNLGDHHIVIEPGSSLTSKSSSTINNTKTYKYTCGDTVVSIKNEELTINEKKYGSLKKGAPILIKDGKVLISNVECQGTPLSQEELNASTIKETIKELNGYSVTIRPGDSSTSMSQIFGTHTLTVGRTKVSIKGPDLFVNKVPYGQLKTSDTILIENGKVFVSGVERKQNYSVE